MKITKVFTCAICGRKFAETDETVLRSFYGPEWNRREICYECWRKLWKPQEDQVWLQFVRDPCDGDEIRKRSAPDAAPPGGDEDAQG